MFFVLLAARRHRPFCAVVLGLSLYNGAVIAEILRAGITSLPARSDARRRWRSG